MEPVKKKRIGDPTQRNSFDWSQVIELCLSMLIYHIYEVDKVKHKLSWTNLFELLVTN